MFSHKKFQAALIASLIALLGGYASGLADTGDLVLALAYVDWTMVIAPWLFAIGAQGAADIGKERAKIEADYGIAIPLDQSDETRREGL